MKTIKAYKIIKTLEETNTAIIHKVQDKSGNLHALKIARLNNKEYNDLIIREFQILNQIKHPNIVTVMDMDADDDGRTFFLQPYLPGKAINTCFASFDPDLVNTLLGIISALAVLHNKGFIHGDLKPEHLLYDAQAKKTVLIDFGYARVPDDPGIRTGTIGYIAPEVIKGVGLDQRSDVYSLGVIIYEILTGKSLGAPWQDVPSVPDAVNRLLRRMCAQEPAVRPTIAEIHETLSSFGTIHIATPHYDVRLPPTTFVERQMLWDKLTKAQGASYTLCGEPGAGKTRILSELKYHFMQQGYTAFYYFAGEQISLMESLCMFLGIQKNDIIDGEDKYAVFQNVHSYIVQHATRSPMVFLIDEVEILRDFDRALLRFIGFGLKTTTACMICTTSNSQTANSLGFSTLVLEPFTIAETEQLINNTLCPLRLDKAGKSRTLQDISQWLHKHSGGNPLYLVELLTTLFKQKILTFSQYGWHFDQARFDHVHIPEHLENLILERYEHVDKQDQIILQTLALIEMPVDPGVLANIFGNDYFTSIERLKQNALIKEDNIMNKHVVFIPNQILGNLVRAKIRKHEKNKYRQQLIKAFEHTEPSDQTYISFLATLYDTVGYHDQAIEYAKQAAQNAESVYDHATAVAFYRIILRNSPKRTKVHITTALKIAELLTTMGKCKEALAIYQDLSDHTPKSFHQHIITGIGRAYYFMGQYKEAIVNLRKALGMLKDKNTETAIDIQTRLAYCLTVTRTFDEAKKLIDQSIAKAQAIGNARLVSAALYYKAVLEQQKGELKQSIRSAEEHIRFADKNNIPRGNALSMLLLSRIYQEQNNLDDALQYVNTAIVHLKKTKDIVALLNAMDCKASILSNQGEINQAYILYEQTLLKAKQVDNRPVIISCFSALSTINLMMGKFDQALANAQEGLIHAPKKASLLSIIINIHLINSDIEQAYSVLEIIPDQQNNLHYHRTAMYIAAEHSKRLEVHQHFKQIEHIIHTEKFIQNVLNATYRDCLYSLYQINDYHICTEYIEKILNTTSSNDIYHVIARAFFKLIAFHTSDSPLDINPEIDWLRHALVVYEMLRLQRLKIQALMTNPMSTESIRATNRELLDCIEIAKSIQANHETSCLQDLQHKLLSQIVHQELASSPPSGYLDVFSQIAVLIERDLGKENFLQNLLDIVIPTTKAERGALFLNTSQGIEFIVGRDMDQTTLVDATELSRTVIREINKNKIVFTHNAQLDPVFNIKKSVVLNKIRSLLCIPLTIDDNVIGALYLDTRFQEKMFSEHDKEFLLTVARILAAVIDRSRAVQKIMEENTTLRTSIIPDIGQGYLIGKSKVMKKVYDLIDRVAATNSPVLLIGETGTGKGMLARLIHQKGARQDKNFTVINCSTIPETLLESELFGHKKGAFTGAIADKTGLLEHAHGGTVFLDEITNTSPAFQAKLLEAIEDKMIRRVGETKTYVIDVRFIFATNKDLEIEVEEGRFRKDLYYRINVFKIDIPPLRERSADISLLARFFLEKSCMEIGKNVIGFTPKAIDTMRHYFWAGNVRELRHVVERAVVLAKGINITHRELNLGAETRPDTGSIKALKKEAIIEALEATNYNTSQAAKILGVNRRTIQRYRKTFNF